MRMLPARQSPFPGSQNSPDSRVRVKVKARSLTLGTLQAMAWQTLTIAYATNAIVYIIDVHFDSIIRQSRNTVAADK